MSSIDDIRARRADTRNSDVHALLDECDRLAELCREHKERAESTLDLDRCKREGADVLREFAFQLVERELRQLHLSVHDEAEAPVWYGEEQDGWSLLQAVDALRKESP